MKEVKASIYEVKVNTELLPNYSMLIAAFRSVPRGIKRGILREELASETNPEQQSECQQEEDGEHISGKQ